MDSIIGRNILNCSFRYEISLNNINLNFQPRDIYSYYSLSFKHRQLGIIIFVDRTSAM